MVARALRRVAELIDRAWPLILAVCVTALVVLVVRSIDQGSQLRQLVEARHTDKLAREAEALQRLHNAALNRGINVETWCGSINNLIASDRRILRLADPPLAKLVTPSLPCLAIVTTTLESASHPPMVTPTGTPLVYRATH